MKLTQTARLGKTSTFHVLCRHPNLGASNSLTECYGLDKLKKGPKCCLTLGNKVTIKSQLCRMSPAYLFSWTFPVQVVRRWHPWKWRADGQPAGLFGLIVGGDAGRWRLVGPGGIVLRHAVMAWHFARHHGLEGNRMKIISQWFLVLP